MVLCWQAQVLELTSQWLSAVGNFSQIYELWLLPIILKQATQSIGFNLNPNLASSPQGKLYSGNCFGAKSESRAWPTTDQPSKQKKLNVCQSLTHRDRRNTWIYLESFLIWSHLSKHCCSCLFRMKKASGNNAIGNFD